MNTHPLERLLVYADKEDLTEFDIPEAEFDELYELFVTTKDFVLAMILGIAVGTYSSIFFAATLLVFYNLKRDKKLAAA